MSSGVGESGTAKLPGGGRETLGWRKPRGAVHPVVGAHLTACVRGGPCGPHLGACVAAYPPLLVIICPSRGVAWACRGCVCFGASRRFFFVFLTWDFVFFFSLFVS